MAQARTSSSTRRMLALVLCLAPASLVSGGPLSFSGGIVGEVKSAAGIAEMGAKVLLYDRHEQLVRQVISNEQGRFGFAGLNPDIYSIRVTLAAFVPAVRRNIQVTSGSESLLRIQLSGIFSTVDIMASGSHGTLMSDDWKWVLRASPSTRPVLRFLPATSSQSTNARTLADVFSGTEGLVKVSAGDSDAFSAPGQQDLGTAFALATSIYGKSKLSLSGNVGYSANGAAPAAGFRTTYSRTNDNGSTPEITVSMRQLYLPGRGDSIPMLRSASIGAYDHLELGDTVRLEYGFNYESVTFLDHLNYVSPFARATWNLDDKSSIRAAFSSGTQPGQLLAHGGEVSDALSQDLAALAMAPRVSIADAHTRVERRESFEASYQRVVGTRTYAVGAYHEAVSNAAFLLSGPADFLPQTDLLTELGSSSQVFNLGSYHRSGYSGSFTQALGDHFDVTLAGGRGGALLPGSNTAVDAATLRSAIQTVQKTWLSARVTKTLPVTGTRIITSYGWTDFRAMMPSHLSLTEPSNLGTTQDAGWNIYFRQPLPPLPGVFGAFGRFEATAELRNLLAQGYLPLFVNDQKAVLTNNPRAVRGGLSFIF